MLHMLTTMLFLSTGMISLAVIAAMMIDHAHAIAHALRLVPANDALPVRTPSRVRVVRSVRLTPLPATQRAAA